MNHILNISRRGIPIRTAIPWFLVLALSPYFLDYFIFLGEALVGVWASHGPVTSTNLGTDFREFWSVAHLATGQDATHIYDPAWFSVWQTDHIAPAKNLQPYLQYLYPPPNVLVALISAPFDFMRGFTVWTLLLTIIGLALLRWKRVPWIVIGLSSIGPAFTFNLIIGQLGFLTGTLFISGILAIDENPLTAGALLGALVIKPQAGLLGPVMLLARRRFNALATGAIIVAVLCIAVTFVCGWDIWPAYLQHGMAKANEMLVASFPNIYEIKGTSVFGMFHSFGASTFLSGIAQAISAAGAIIWCWRAWRRPETNRVALTALTVALTLLVTPYGLSADMCGFSIMVVWLAWERRRLETSDVLMWIWPGLCPVVSSVLHAQLTPLNTFAWSLPGSAKARWICYVKNSH
jgi:alpha-1,2-mannosyltransferase